MQNTETKGRIGGIILVVFASFIWGFGFVAMRWAAESMPPLWITPVRFGLVAAFLAPIYLLIPSLRGVWHKTHVSLAMLPGLLLACILLAQTCGVQYTSVARCSFITTLYVIFVPFFARVFLGRSFSVLHWLWVFIALVGTGFMVQLDEGPVNKGDMLTLVCAIFATLHILLLERIAPQISSAHEFNFLQSTWAFVFSLPVALLFSPWYFQSSSYLGIVGVLFLVGPSTMFAFLCQVQAQQYIPASVVSLLFLLESPFAAAAAWLIHQEKLTTLQLVGAILIVLSAVGVTLELSWKPLTNKDHHENIDSQ